MHEERTRLGADGQYIHGLNRALGNLGYGGHADPDDKGTVVIHNPANVHYLNHLSHEQFKDFM